MKQTNAPVSKFKTQYNATSHTLGRYEKVSKRTMTVPDQSMSIETILKRYAQGLSPSGVKVPMYYNDDPIPDFQRMDLTDRMDFIKDSNENVSKLSKQYKKEQDDKNAKSLRDRLKKELSQESEQLVQDPPSSKTD